MTLKESMETLVDKFNDRIQEDPKLHGELQGITKRVHMDLGSVSYSFVLEDCRVDGVIEGAIDSPDIVVESDPNTIEGLISKRIRPMKAFALRKVKLHGDFDDLMRFRKMF